MGGWGGGSSEAGEGVRRGAAVTEASALGPSAPCVCGQHEFYRSDSDSIARSCFGGSSATFDDCQFQRAAWTGF